MSHRMYNFVPKSDVSQWFFQVDLIRFQWHNRRHDNHVITFVFWTAVEFFFENSIMWLHLPSTTSLFIGDPFIFPETIPVANTNAVMF